MLGYRDHEVGETRGEWLGRVHADDRAPLTQALDAYVHDATTEHFEFEHRVQHRDGAYRWLLARAIAVRDARKQATRVVGSVTDVTDRREAERRLQHDALHDALTGLPNRVLFVDRLDQAIRRAQRHHPECCAAVLFLDLDRFKIINDTLGHATGDELLKAVARRLEPALRPNDTVARLCGDEFTLLLDDVCDPREATVISERVLQQLHAAVRASTAASCSSARRSGSRSPPRRSQPEQVMRDADVAMYRAKADGKGRHAVFDAAMHEQVMRRLDLEGDLRTAIERGSLEVGYQPIVQAATGRIVGFEALGRWPHGEPAEVLALADETGLAVPLGRQVLETAARSSRSGASCPSGAGLTIGVNVTARQLGEPGFVGDAPRDPRGDRARPARAAPRGLRARPQPRPRGRGHAPRARAGARAARRAHAHRRLRHGRVAAAAAAPLPGRRDQGLTRARGRHRPRRGRVRDRARGRRAGAQPRARGDRRRRREARAARLPEGARLRVRPGLPHLRPAQRGGGAGAAGEQRPACSSSAWSRRDARARRRVVAVEARGAVAIDGLVVATALVVVVERAAAGASSRRGGRHGLAAVVDAVAVAVVTTGHGLAAIVDAVAVTVVALAVVDAVAVAVLPAKRSRSDSSISSWSAMPFSCRPARS